MATQLMGLIGEIQAGASPTFLYNLITPDFSQQPKRPNNPFSGGGNYPSCVALYQQRRVFASTNNKPSTLFLSGIASYDDFSESRFSDGSFTLDLDSYFFDPIDHILAAQFGIFLFSERGVYLVVAGGGGGITANSALSKNELASGSKRDLRPLRILNNIVFMSNLDNSPRALASVETTPNQFSTQDLALYSQHLFQGDNSFLEEPTDASTFDLFHKTGAEIVSWTYSGRTDRIIWAVRADGTLLSCTYAPEHQINAWCKHATKGRFRAVQSVYEKNVDTVYLAVERGEHTFIEYFDHHRAKRFEQSTPVDAAVRTVNYEPTIVTPLYIDEYENGVRQGPENALTRAESFAGYTGLGVIIVGDGLRFSSSDVGNYIRTLGGLYRITNFRSTRHADIVAIHEVPTSSVGYFVHGTTYRHPIYQWELVDQKEVYNCFHLQQQETYAIEGDELVKRDVANAPSSSGQLSTQDASARGMTIGLPFKSYVKTLPFIVAEDVVENKPKRSFRIGLRCTNSSSMDAGVNDDLYPVIFEDGEEKTAFSSGVFNVDVASDWEIDDSLSIESFLPFTILGIVTSFDTGDEERSRSGLRGSPRVSI